MKYSCQYLEFFACLVFFLYSRIGNRAPSYCTAVGKAILAYLLEKEIDPSQENWAIRDSEKPISLY
jgi:DNA-binding IclR family transcriptional regulator